MFVSHPSSNTIVLEYAPDSFTQLEMFGILGNLLLSEPITESRKHFVDLSNFRNGLYFLRVSDGVNTIIKKIVKTK